MIEEKCERHEHIKWKMKVEQNIKGMYKYDKQCIEFLKKYDIVERKFM